MLKGERAYPKEIIIGNSQWGVCFKNVMADKRKDYTLHGLCCPDVKMIYIARKQDCRQILETFLHEALHAMEAEYDFELGHDKIFKLEVALADFFVQNYDAIKGVLA